MGKYLLYGLAGIYYSIASYHLAASILHIHGSPVCTMGEYQLYGSLVYLSMSLQYTAEEYLSYGFASIYILLIGVYQLVTSIIL